MIETRALTAVPMLGDAPFVTHDPGVQLFTVERNVNVSGGVQALMLPTFHVTVLPEIVGAEPPDRPTSAIDVIQLGTLSVTVTLSVEMLET
jgi:hypothetical protein